MAEKDPVLQIKKGLDYSQLFSSPDFPENCKWTKTEESWGTALTSKWHWDSDGPVRSQAVSRPYLSPMIAALLPICITVFHYKLCWTTKKLRLCILYLLCSNVCQTLFHVGLVLSGVVCTFHQQTKKLPSCELPALPGTAASHPVYCIYVYMSKR